MYTELAAPMYGTRDGLPVIVVGAFLSGGQVSNGDLRFVVVDSDGEMSECRLGEVVVDVRFQDNAWHDVSPGPETPEE
jgi:hypothetical protein